MVPRGIKQQVVVNLLQWLLNKKTTLNLIFRVFLEIIIVISSKKLLSY